MKLMPSCEEVSRLLSKALDEPLGLLDRGMLQVHLSMCGSCRNVDAQLRELHGMAQDLFAAGPADEPNPAAPGVANGGGPRNG